MKSSKSGITIMGVPHRAVEGYNGIIRLFY